VTPRIFDSSFERQDNEVRARHGKPWDPVEEQTLERLFKCNSTLKGMCVSLERPATGTLMRLCKLGLLKKQAEGMYRYKYFYAVEVGTDVPDTLPTPTPTPTEEITMTAPTIETKTFIAGREASTLSDEQIFSLIADLESAADKLGKIRNKPKKLVANIEKMQADISKLVEYVDGR